MKKSFFNWIVDQWSTVPPVETADLSGRTVVIVGGNAGIGFEAAKHFANMNPAKLVLACRSESKGKAASAEIQKATGFKKCEVMIVDLADFASAKRFAERFNQEHDRLDILVMNAAVLMRTYEETVNGWESSLQVNHLASALVALLLLPRLIETGRKFKSTSRLVVVSATLHYWTTFPDDVRKSSSPITKVSDTEHRSAKTMGHRYPDTKLINVFFARALHDRLQSATPLTVNAVNPGFCYSTLRRDYTNIVVSIFEKLLAFTSEQGGRQLVYAAIAKQDNEDQMKGAFISMGAVSEASDFVLSQEGKNVQDTLWRETIEILAKESPELSTIIQEHLVQS